MSEAGSDERLLTIRNAVDFSIVEDNVQDIAEFTVEKHEFRTGAMLPPEVRERAIARIRDVLWQKVEALKLRRQQLLEGMFRTAQETLDEVVDQTARSR